MPDDDADENILLTFPFRFSSRYTVAGLPFGVTPWTTALVVTADRLEVRFGPWRLSTARSNIVHAEVAGPYRFVKTGGPPHLSFSDHGVTFATNGRQGTCIVFAEPVTALNPLGPPRHPNLTVTVAEPQVLADVLGAPTAA